MVNSNLAQPCFERQLIEDHRKDGYWIEAFDINNDSKPDILGYGLNAGEVCWFKNPDWEKTLITTLPGPVGMHHADINGNGLLDVVICYQYGKTMVECDPEGGKIIWLENPGTTDGEWKKHYIGRATAMHRLKVGHFTQNEKWEVLALPIVGRPHDVHSEVPVMLFTQPDDVNNATEWQSTLIDGSYYHVIHGVAVKKFAPDSDLDSVLLASEEGVTWLYYDPKDQQWHKELIGTGELTQVYKTGFKGSGDVDAGKVGNDSFAYIATVEPFHGNTVAVYYKDSDSDNSLTGTSWKRVVLDVYDNPNVLGEGPCHFVVCADFDNDGDDEFIVALRGPMPWQGVFYYKAIDVKNGVFAKWRVSSDSAARIAVADFNGDGRLDFATVGYWVEGYYCTDNPQILLFENKFAEVKK